ncbi:hypothetical protein [Devosia sp. A449]
MNVRSILSIAAITATMALPGLAVAQEEHLIGGMAVPADQVEEVQTKCDLLRSSDDSAVDNAADAITTPPPPSSATAEGWLEDGSKVDIEKLTVQLCEEGNFITSTE